MRFPVGAAALGWCAAVVPARPVSARPPPDSLRLTLVAPESVRVGQPVPLVLRLTNVTDQPVGAHFLGRTIAFDIVIAREDGAVVWRRLAGTAVQGILQIKTLAPGETLELRDVWRQRTNAGSPVPPETYVVRGLLPSDDPTPRRTPDVRLRIIP